jgi:hypothetical protein
MGKTTSYSPFVTPVAPAPTITAEKKPKRVKTKSLPAVNLEKNEKSTTTVPAAMTEKEKIQAELRQIMGEIKVKAANQKNKLGTAEHEQIVDDPTSKLFSSCQIQDFHAEITGLLKVGFKSMFLFACF